MGRSYLRDLWRDPEVPTHWTTPGAPGLGTAPRECRPGLCVTSRSVCHGVNGEELRPDRWSGRWFLSGHFYRF